VCEDEIKKSCSLAPHRFDAELRFESRQKDIWVMCWKISNGPPPPPGVNFINILQAAFAPIFFHKKIIPELQVQKSCSKHFHTKKARVKC